MSDRITSAEVAARAGVSQSAVSRVFTPGGSASAKTAQKVRKAAEELGYRPNTLARAMASGKSRIIGLVVAYLDNQFYPTALELLSNALQAEGYHLLVFTAPNTVEAVDGVIQDLIDYQVDGIIAASASMSSGLAARTRAAGIPVVLFNRSQDAGGISNVTSTNHAGAYEIGHLLAAAGHNRIAHISGWQGSSTGRERRAGLTQALAEAGQAPIAILDGMYDRQRAIDCTREILPLGPDAIFVGNDHMAFPVIDTLRAEGLKPGKDISVIGFDDVPIAAWPAYNLTTYRQPLNAMVKTTVATLLTQIADPAAPPSDHAIPGRLIARASARLPQGYAP